MKFHQNLNISFHVIHNFLSRSEDTVLCHQNIVTSSDHTYCYRVTSIALSGSSVIARTNRQTDHNYYPALPFRWRGVTIYWYVMTWSTQNSARRVGHGPGLSMGWIGSGRGPKCSDVHGSGRVGYIAQNIFKIVNTCFLTDQPVVWVCVSVADLLSSLQLLRSWLVKRHRLFVARTQVPFWREWLNKYPS